MAVRLGPRGPGSRTRAGAPEERLQWSGQPWWGSAAIAGSAATASRSGTSVGTSRRATTLVRPAAARRTTRPRSDGHGRQVGTALAPARVDECARDVVPEGGDGVGAARPVPRSRATTRSGTSARCQAAAAYSGPPRPARPGCARRRRGRRRRSRPAPARARRARTISCSWWPVACTAITRAPETRATRAAARGALGPYLDRSGDVPPASRKPARKREDAVALLLVAGDAAGRASRRGGGRPTGRARRPPASAARCGGGRRPVLHGGCSTWSPSSATTRPTPRAAHNGPTRPATPVVVTTRTSTPPSSSRSGRIEERGPVRRRTDRRHGRRRGREPGPAPVWRPPSSRLPRPGPVGGSATSTPTWRRAAGDVGPAQQAPRAAKRRRGWGGGRPVREPCPASDPDLLVSARRRTSRRGAPRATG